MKQFLKASLVRALRTMAQALIASIGSAAIVSEVDWKLALSATLMAGILSMLTSIITGLPEVEEDE